jgi:hypothetical protein
LRLRSGVNSTGRRNSNHRRVRGRGHFTVAAKARAIHDETLSGVAPTRAYLARRPSRLDPCLKRYLEACLMGRFGFYEILDCVPGIGFKATDVIFGVEWAVRERAASQTLQDRDIAFAQIVYVDGVALLAAVAPVNFPPLFKTHLIRLQRRGELRQ